ncbi:hypothetical protein WJX74_002713 [Apatococcus lobatus]|uniref:Uncharacterized protein n=1 Tax=Apatococcus lobatus TaxID=904363 RepID=A0AAW1RLT6_9CHLO
MPSDENSRQLHRSLRLGTRHVWLLVFLAALLVANLPACKEAFGKCLYGKTHSQPIVASQQAGSAQGSPAPGRSSPLQDECKLVTSTGLQSERDSVGGWLYILRTGSLADQQIASAALKTQAIDIWDVVLEIGERGGAPICLNILADPDTAADVREFAAWLLSQLVSGTWIQKQPGSETWADVQGSEVIFEAGGIQVLAEALQSSSGYLQSHVAWVGARMAQHPQMSEQITSTSISIRLLEMSMIPDDSYNIPTRAAWALAELAESSSVSRKVIADLGTAMRFIGNLADAHGNHDVYTATALGALASLALHDPTAAASGFHQLTPWQINAALESPLPEVRAQAARLVANIAMANGNFKKQIVDSTSCMSNLSKLVYDPAPKIRNQAVRALFSVASV